MTHLGWTPIKFKPKQHSVISNRVWFMGNSSAMVKTLCGVMPWTDIEEISSDLVDSLQERPESAKNACSHCAATYMALLQRGHI